MHTYVRTYTCLERAWKKLVIEAGSRWKMGWIRDNRGQGWDLEPLNYISNAHDNYLSLILEHFHVAINIVDIAQRAWNGSHAAFWGKLKEQDRDHGQFILSSQGRCTMEDVAKAKSALLRLFFPPIYFWQDSEYRSFGSWNTMTSGKSTNPETVKAALLTHRKHTVKSSNRTRECFLCKLLSSYAQKSIHPNWVPTASGNAF